MQYGYVRVSTDEQTVALQMDALAAIGCEKVFRDEGVSAVSPQRPGFDAVLSALNSGDTLVTWKLDRAFRSTVEAILTVKELRERGVELRCTSMPLDLSTPEGRKWFRDCASQAEYEREVISQRTRAGMAAARARGARIGRPSVMTPRKLARAQKLLENGKRRIPQIAKAIGVGRATLYRALRNA